MDKTPEAIDWQKAKVMLAELLKTLGPLLITALIGLLSKPPKE